MFDRDTSIGTRVFVIVVTMIIVAIFVGAIRDRLAVLSNPRWATLMAALVAHEFTESDRRPPAWTDGRCLADPWTVDSLRLSPDEVRAQTPEWLAERNVFISPRDLMTVWARSDPPGHITDMSTTTRWHGGDRNHPASCHWWR